jgi:branched-chain amino acid transport system permease protein
LLAYQLTAFSPNSFYLNQTIPIVVMVVLGGANSVAGAVVGATLLTGWQEFVRNVENGHIGPIHFPAVNGIAEMSLGIGLILLLLARPAGVMGSWEPQLVIRRRHNTSSHQPKAPVAFQGQASEPAAAATEPWPQGDE